MFEKTKEEPFSEAIDLQNVTMVEEMLREDPELANISEQSATPLMWARSTEMVELLLKYDADTNIRDSIGRISLHYNAFADEGSSNQAWSQKMDNEKHRKNEINWERIVHCREKHLTSVRK